MSEETEGQEAEGDRHLDAMGMAVVNVAIGGVFAFVLIQEKLAPLLSDTFFVPGYFHFLTLGTVTLTFIAALLYVIPGITGHALWRPAVMAKLPYVTTFGLLIFGGAGIAAGYSGVPRRVLDVAYQGDAPGSWAVLMAFVGIGAVVMAAALAVYVYGLFRTLLWPVRETSIERAGLAATSWGGRHRRAQQCMGWSPRGPRAGSGDVRVHLDRV